MDVQGDNSPRRATTKNPSNLQWFALKSRHRVVNGEITNEPLNIIAAANPVSCAIYGRDSNLPDHPGWMRFKFLAKGEKTTSSPKPREFMELQNNIKIQIWLSNYS